MVNIKKTTILKILIFTSLLILLLLSSLIFLKTNDISLEEEESVLFHVHGIENPEQMIWFEDSLLIKKGRYIKKMDVEKRILEYFKDIKENQILGIYKNELVLIEYENHIITSPQEDATDIVILNLNEKGIFSGSFHETIKPIYLDNNSLFLIDNYYNSPERTYRIDLLSGKIELYEIKHKLILEGEEIIEVLDETGEHLFNIPKVNDIMSFSTNENLDKIALLDTQGIVWIFLKNPNN